MRKAPLALLLLLLVVLTGCTTTADNAATDKPATDSTAADKVDYADPGNWAYLEADQPKNADVFFLCPTVFQGSQEATNMPLDDREAKESFQGAINMEKGIYVQNCRLFAPYYRQMAMAIYSLPREEWESHLDFAYQDVREAFLYYLDHYNQGQPIILAGFSQGADMCLRLMKDCFAQEELQDQLVACYAIGWSLTQEEVDAYPQLRLASSAGDTGGIITYNTEAESVTDSPIVPMGTKTLATNPLNWVTDSTPAGKEENLGACFTNYSGTIVTEIPQFTGAYLDPSRGTLKVTDVDPSTFPPGLSLFESGIYHVYDYQFFYRNLQANVALRLENYLAQQAQEAA